MKEEDTNMEIKRPAIAGTLESSDCQVMVEAGEGKIDLSLDSAVIEQHGNRPCGICSGVHGKIPADHHWCSGCTADTDV